MRERNAAPIDPALLERVLQPVARARTLPSEAYASPEVFAWEQSVQRNVASPGYRQGPVSPWEADVWQEMSVIARGYTDGRLSPWRRAQL